MAARHEKACYKKKPPYIFSFAKGYRTMTSGWQGAPYFRRCGRELVSKPAISFKKSWGGANVDQLNACGWSKATPPRHDPAFHDTGATWMPTPQGASVGGGGGKRPFQRRAMREWRGRGFRRGDTLRHPRGRARGDQTFCHTGQVVDPPTLDDLDLFQKCMIYLAHADGWDPYDGTRHRSPHAWRSRSFRDLYDLSSSSCWRVGARAICVILL